MNYNNIYNRLIETRKNLDRRKGEQYFEVHHIVPRSFGGSDDELNLVMLTAKEHWIAHLLLERIARGQNRYSASQAVVNMGRVIHASKRKTYRLYAKARKTIAEEVSKKTYRNINS